MVYEFIIENLDYLLMFLLGLVLLLVVLKNKHKVEIQKLLFPLFYIVMYRTSWGLKHMNHLAKKLMPARGFISWFSIVIGFIGMGIITYSFVKEAIISIFLNKPAPVGVLLPGAELPGLPALSFTTWIIVIFVLAGVHEFMHGVLARMYNIPVKSSGFAIMGVVLPFIPAAFVEPNEKVLAKAPTKAQLAMLSAGPVANFVTALIFGLILAFLIAPAASGITQYDGIKIVNVDSDSPSSRANVLTGEKIISIDGKEINNLEEFLMFMNTTTPYQKVTLITDANTYSITLDKKEDREVGYIGLGVAPEKAEVRPEVQEKYGTFLPTAFLAIIPLFTWLYLANLFVGLFNLLPIWIVDGGRMFYLGLKAIIKNEKATLLIWNTISFILLALVLFFLIPALFNYFAAPFR